MSDTNIRRASFDDLELILSWQSNPRVYRDIPYQDDALKWEDYIKWFCTRSPKCRDFLIEYHERRVGVVSITVDGRVGVYMGEVTLWDEGVASKALSLACTQVNDRSLYSKIHKSNSETRRTFRKCGFKCTDNEEEFKIYEEN
jgi:RimJ/RimL family protein N-acetyltransferase